ncbi:DUF4142 domain-containing protein [Pseudomonas cannabina]|uniref:DUF4142 domain-containing protein n=3 Tax=Pseudomonas syringae group TaxID=136849 RepID=A0A3M3Q5W0_PSECA|nr:MULTISPECIES: DUF4142 domain-containing protein [Pseudomonas syringae group]KPB77213.1 Uncharacterized protein AC507_2290 [Pseudomonas syringae pv. maculicola]KPW20071.1 Uncharacterized protein ALO83_01696 [Pseudomonas cannabina pv. alisalensis]MBM0141800.1 DUF4142 domain-containing protein [Pseudomonas cannabina pv. alisalensis]QHE99974.1 DUF4142 domain-containing protein [Pseudomonas syringae pv. maculicola str. ES4326]QQN22046.1 DUF4142 domain-containing protein [Pseudomonas cannabina pv
MNNYFRMSAIAVVLSLGSQVAVAAQDADDFVEDASAKGIAEVQLGKLALDEKDISPSVKEFAEQMVKDHTAANEKLATIAKNKKLEVSDDPMLMDKAKALILEMRKKSFDQAYANNQVVAHEETIKLYEEEANNGKDPELMAFAKATLPTLKEHLAHAKKLAAEHGGDAAKK